MGTWASHGALVSHESARMSAVAVPRPSDEPTPLLVQAMPPRPPVRGLDLAPSCVGAGGRLSVARASGRGAGGLKNLRAMAAAGRWGWRPHCQRARRFSGRPPSLAAAGRLRDVAPPGDVVAGALEVDVGGGAADRPELGLQKQG